MGAHAHARFRHAIERRALRMAEDAARELPNLPLEDALRLVHLCPCRDAGGTLSEAVRPPSVHRSCYSDGVTAPTFVAII